MKTWIHFTEDAQGFIEDVKSIEGDDPASFAAEGLFIYCPFCNSRLAN